MLHEPRCQGLKHEARGQRPRLSLWLWLLLLPRFGPRTTHMLMWGTSEAFTSKAMLQLLPPGITCARRVWWGGGGCVEVASRGNGKRERWPAQV